MPNSNQLFGANRLRIYHRMNRISALASKDNHHVIYNKIWSDMDWRNRAEHEHSHSKILSTLYAVRAVLRAGLGTILVVPNAYSPHNVEDILIMNTMCTLVISGSYLLILNA